MLRFIVSLSIALAACSADAYKLLLNTNMLPGVMSTNSGEWALGRGMLDGLIGMGAPHRTDPMAKEDREAFFTSFETSHNILTISLQKLQQSDAPTRASNIEAWAASRKFPMDELLIWDEESALGGGTPGIDALQFVRSAGVGPVLVLARGYGNNEAGVKAVLAHPWCSGVVIEGTPFAFVTQTARSDIALHVLGLGKRVYLMIPPSGPGKPNQARNYLANVRAMMAALKDKLGTNLYHDKLAIVPAVYSVLGEEQDYLPEVTHDGEPANTFAGTVLYLGQNKAAPAS